MKIGKFKVTDWKNGIRTIIDNGGELDFHITKMGNKYIFYTIQFFPSRQLSLLHEAMQTFPTYKVLCKNKYENLDDAKCAVDKFLIQLDKLLVFI